MQKFPGHIRIVGANNRKSGKNITWTEITNRVFSTQSDNYKYLQTWASQGLTKSFWERLQGGKFHAPAPRCPEAPTQPLGTQRACFTKSMTETSIWTQMTPLQDWPSTPMEQGHCVRNLRANLPVFSPYCIAFYMGQGGHIICKIAHICDGSALVSKSIQPPHFHLVSNSNTFSHINTP